MVTSGCSLPGLPPQIRTAIGLLTVKDHIGDGVKLSAVNQHNMLDAVHTIGRHDFPLGVGWFLLCRQDLGQPFARCQHSH